MNKVYQMNENYFSEINSHEKAYILGFIYADGNIINNLEKTKYCLRIVQKGERKDVLEKIVKALNSNIPIKEYVPNVFSIAFCSKQIANDLTKLGAIPNKSLVLQFPTEDIVPKKYMSSFILGCFDGDGCVWNGKRKKMWVKNEKKPGTMRERIVHNVKFTYTGNVDFVNALQDYLVNLGIVNKKTKLNFSKAKCTNNSTCDRVCTMEYSGRKQMQKLYEYMYSNSPIWCEEKKLKFEKIFCASEEKFSEDTSLIARTPEMVISSEASNVEERSSTIPEMGVELSDSKCEAPNEKDEGEDIVSSTIK